MKGASIAQLIVVPSLAFFLASSSAMADWVGLARFTGVVEISVSPGEITLNLRLRDSIVPAHLTSSNELSAWLLAQLPSIRIEGGKPLIGHLQSVNRQPATDNKSVGFYEAVLSYPIEGKFEGLSITPPDETSQAMGLVLLHRGIPVADLMAFNKPVKVSLNWQDPWQSRFDNPEFIRRHTEPRSYIYVESYEVRHELLLRVKDLKPWLDFGLIDSHYIEEKEMGRLKNKIGNFLLTKNPLNIDASPVSPQLDRVEFVRFDRSGVVPVRGDGRMDTETALVGVLLTYLTEQPARDIRLQWELFGETAAARQVSLSVGKETFDAYMTSTQPFFDWSRDELLNPASLSDAETDLVVSSPAELGHDTSLVLKSWAIAASFIGLSVILFRPRFIQRRYAKSWFGIVLLLSVGLLFHPLAGKLAEKSGGATKMVGDSQTTALLQSLLHNVYRAFALRDEEKAYDRFAKSLDGDLLEAVYLQQRKAIFRQSKGLGGEGRVDRIELLDSHVQGSAPVPNVLQVTSRWLAHGTVSHWGHSHERHNLYQARLTLRFTPAGGWKIVGMEFLGGQRLEPDAALL